MGERYLPESEAARLIEKAARLQEASREGSDAYSPGISVSELERIASEAGIDPKFLQMAMSQPMEPTVQRRSLSLVEERETVINGELDEDGWEEVGELLRQNFRFTTPISSGRTRTYILNGGWLTNGAVEIVSRKGRTRLKVRSNAFLAYFVGVHGPLIGGFAILLPMLISFQKPLGLVLLVMSALALASALLFRMILGRTRAAANDLFMRLSDLVATQAKNVSTEEAPTTVADTSEVVRQQLGRS